MRTRTLCTAALLCLASAVARADTFSFQYTFFNGNVLAGTLTGTLAADHNTFHVSGADTITYDGAVVTINPNAFQSFTSYYNDASTGNPPQVDDSGILTLDGSTENFVDLNQANRDGFGFDVNTNTPGDNVIDAAFTPQSSETFIPSRFVASASISSPAMASTPEPSSFALLGTGLLGMVGAIRRRLA